MKKLIIVSILFLIGTESYSNNVFNNSIKLPKYYKTHSTFSGDLLDNNSFHLIFTKNKKSKKYEVLPYLYDGKNITKLESIEGKHRYSLVSHHQKGDVLSILLSYNSNEKKYVKRFDLNLLTKSNSSSKYSFLHEDFFTSAKGSDKSILIYKDKELFSVRIFNGYDESILKEIKFSGRKDKLRKFFSKHSVEYVKLDEFVSNGSINDVRLYFDSNSLIFTKDTDKPVPFMVASSALNTRNTNTTEAVTINLNNDLLSPVFSVFNNGGETKFKKRTSFYRDGILYQMGLSNKFGKIQVSNFKTLQTLNVININNDISSFILSNNSFVGIEKFLKNAAKKKYNTTITANKTTVSTIRLRVDYVDMVYNYNMFHHNFMMQMQQQQMQMMNQNVQRSLSRFGPTLLDDTPFENATILKSKRYFEIIIDSKGNLLNNVFSLPIHKENDKESYLEELNDNYKLEMLSSCFVNNRFRFMGFDKKKKKFLIKQDF